VDIGDISSIVDVIAEDREGRTHLKGELILSIMI
jgi:hypothetical protein